MQLKKSQGFTLKRQKTLPKEIQAMIEGGMRQSQVNFKMLKTTNNQLKALAQKTNKAVCTLQEFHSKL